MHATAKANFLCNKELQRMIEEKLALENERENVVDQMLEVKAKLARVNELETILAQSKEDKEVFRLLNKVIYL